MSIEVTGISQKAIDAVDLAEQRFIEGWNIEQIAKAEGLPVDTMRVLIATVNLFRDKQ